MGHTVNQMKNNIYQQKAEMDEECVGLQRY